MMEVQCSFNSKVNMVLFVKKGMARKAMLKNLQEGNIDKVNKQIEKGTVKIINTEVQEIEYKSDPIY